MPKTIKEKVRCKICGKFKTENAFKAGSEICRYCENKRKERIKQQIDIFGIMNTTPTIEEVNERARYMGLSYGQYSATYIYGNKSDPGLKDLVKERLKEYMKEQYSGNDEELNTYINTQLEEAIV